MGNQFLINCKKLCFESFLGVDEHSLKLSVATVDLLCDGAVFVDLVLQLSKERSTHRFELLLLALEVGVQRLGGSV